MYTKALRVDFLFVLFLFFSLGDVGRVVMVEGWMGWEALYSKALNVHFCLFVFQMRGCG